VASLEGANALQIMLKVFVPLANRLTLHKTRHPEDEPYSYFVYRFEKDGNFVVHTRFVEID
jgi:hypothetical protein